MRCLILMKWIFLNIWHNLYFTITAIICVNFSCVRHNRWFSYKTYIHVLVPLSRLLDIFPKRWNSNEIQSLESSLRVGVSRGLGTTFSSPTQWYILGLVYGNRSRPRCVRGEAAPCIVSCPRDRHASRHSCQRESATVKISTPKLRCRRRKNRNCTLRFN